MTNRSENYHPIKTLPPSIVSIWYNLYREKNSKSVRLDGNAPKKLRFGGGCTRAAGVGSPDERSEEPRSLAKQGRKRMRRE
jgi:hypothetical protein